MLMASVSRGSSCTRPQLASLFFNRGSRRAYTNVDKNELKKKLEKGILLVDVRNPDEVAKTGVVKHGGNEAKNIPIGEIKSALELGNDQFKAKYKFDKPSQDTEIIFSCAAGKRSAQASQTAEAASYKKVVNYTGGATDWFKDK